MDMLVASCVAPRRLELERRSVAPLGPHEALIKLAYCGVCPSDLRIFLGLSSSVRYPIQLGHEAAGIVADIGSGVKDLHPGDRVLVDVIRRCGECPACRRGFENHCEKLDWSRGAFAEYITVPAANAFRLRDTTSLSDAALTEPLACAIRGQNQVRPQPGEWALVSGAGPLGLLHLQRLKLLGLRVIVTDLLDWRLAMARELGADEVLNPTCDDLRGVVTAATAGWGLELAVVANGQMQAVSQALDCLGLGGRLLLFAGIYPKTELRVDPNVLHYGEKSIAGTSDYLIADFQEARELIETGAVRVGQLVSDIVPLASVTRALELVEDRSRLKVMVQCDPTAETNTCHDFTSIQS